MEHCRRDNDQNVLPQFFFKDQPVSREQDCRSEILPDAVEAALPLSEEQIEQHAQQKRRAYPVDRQHVQSDRDARGDKDQRLIVIEDKTTKLCEQLKAAVLERNDAFEYLAPVIDSPMVICHEIRADLIPEPGNRYQDQRKQQHRNRLRAQINPPVSSDPRLRKRVRHAAEYDRGRKNRPINDRHLKTLRTRGAGEGT